MGQFQQCTATLFDLYKEGNQGRRSEFIGYKIIHHALNNDRITLANVMSEMTEADLEDNNLTFALEYILSNKK